MADCGDPVKRDGQIGRQVCSAGALAKVLHQVEAAGAALPVQAGRWPLAAVYTCGPHPPGFRGWQTVRAWLRARHVRFPQQQGLLRMLEALQDRQQVASHALLQGGTDHGRDAEQPQQPQQHQADQQDHAALAAGPSHCAALPSVDTAAA
ncbi:hypothetical protein D3C80_1370060 [compost metagenome]